MDQNQIMQLHEEAAKTDLVFDGTPNEKEYRSFLLYQTYHSAYGLFTIVIGLLCIGMLVVYGEHTPLLNKYALPLVALLLLMQSRKGCPSTRCLKPNGALTTRWPSGSATPF